MKIDIVNKIYKSNSRTNLRKVVSRLSSTIRLANIYTPENKASILSLKKYAKRKNVSQKKLFQKIESTYNSMRPQMSYGKKRVIMDFKTGRISFSGYQKRRNPKVINGNKIKYGEAVYDKVFINSKMREYGVISIEDMNWKLGDPKYFDELNRLRAAIEQENTSDVDLGDRDFFIKVFNL